MPFAVRWTVLFDPTSEHGGESGYLTSFDSKAEAESYALEYATAVGVVTVAPRVTGSTTVRTFIAEARNGSGYRERVEVIDRETNDDYINRLNDLADLLAENDDEEA